MEIKQQDIADYLGVSRQIVGSALSGNGRVSEETRQRVLKAAKELGYTEHSNQAARSLIARRYRSRSRKGVFGVLLPRPEGVPSRKLPYFTPFVDGIEEEADAMELAVFLHSFRVGYMPRNMGEFLLDGVIAVAASAGRSEWMHEHGLPLVLLDHACEGFNSIHSDSAAGIVLCTQHLIDLGHRRIHYFGQSSPDGERLTEVRFDSFVATMGRNGLRVDPETDWHLCHRMQRESAKAAMAEVLKGRPNFTAVVCYNDLLAMGVVDALHEAGLRVPDDVSVTGFDDITGAYAFSPEITSVAFDREDMGRRAVRMLYAQVDAVLADPLTVPKAIETVLPVTLVEHNSTAPVGRE